METVIQTKNAVVLTEKDVLMVMKLSNGFKVSQIARSMQYSPRTVEDKIAKLRKKYKCNSATHLVAKFIREGIIK